MRVERFKNDIDDVWRSDTILALGLPVQMVFACTWLHGLTVCVIACLWKSLEYEFVLFTILGTSLEHSL